MVTMPFTGKALKSRASAMSGSGPVSDAKPDKSKKIVSFRNRVTVNTPSVCINATGRFCRALSFDFAATSV
jgi:hypothetical protein